MTNASSSTSGYLSTKGNQIVDDAGKSIQLSGVSWFGMETSRFLPDGLHARGYKSMIDQMKELGFNSIRIPISSEFLDPNKTVGYFDPYRNADLVGLKPIQILDKIVDYAGQVGLKIILDHHRSDATQNGGAQENGLWYTAAYTEQRWISDWVSLAQRYAGNSTVIGAELHNEPFGATWGGNAATDWAAAAERAGNAVLAANPDWLIFVQGVRTYQGQSYWDGGNLMGVKDRPIVLNVPNKIVYAPHDYPASVYDQPWFKAANYPDNLTTKFHDAWGYIVENNIAPVWISEFGSRLLPDHPKDLQWFEEIRSYISGDFNTDGIHDLASGKLGISWNWWSWNPNSGDTGGILKDDWTSVHYDKVLGLDDIMGTGFASYAGYRQLEGTAGADLLTGTAGADRLVGLAGNDMLLGKGGDDLLDGGDGHDAVSYVAAGSMLGLRQQFSITGNSASDVMVAGKGTAAATYGTDTLRNIEQIDFVDGRLVFDNADPAAVVLRMYDAMFDRLPDVGGFNYWVFALQHGTTAETMAASFAASPEFSATYGNLTNQGFVEQLYRNVLDREGEISGVSYWSNLLNQGAMSRGQVLLGFSESSEHAAKLQPIVGAGLWDVDETAAQAARAYSAAFDRAPDADGLIYWTSMLKNGLAPTSMADAFVQSSEFAGKYGTLSTQQFVEQLYLNVLDRAGDASGSAYWTTQLNNGILDRGDVLFGFSESAENIAKTMPTMGDGILLV